MYGRVGSDWTIDTDGQQTAYGFPKDFVATVFVGKELEYVLFSANTVTLSFSGHVKVTVLAALQHQVPLDSNLAIIQSVPLSESRLMQLPGRCVSGATIDDEATLVLVFDNGHALKVFGDSPCFECFWVDLGKRHIVI